MAAKRYMFISFIRLVGMFTSFAFCGDDHTIKIGPLLLALRIDD